MKQCRKCKEWKDVGEFYKDSQNKDGLHSWCKNCMNEGHKIYRIKYIKSEKGRKQRKKSSKKYYESHKKQIALKKKIWKKNNSEKVREYERKWRKSPRGRKLLYEQEKRMKKKYPWYRTHGSIRARCSYKNSWYYKKGIKNFLTPTDLKFLWFRDKAYLLKQPSIDRKNNNGNYTLKNCRYIEMSKNRPQKR